MRLEWFFCFLCWVGVLVFCWFFSLDFGNIWQLYVAWLKILCGLNRCGHGGRVFKSNICFWVLGQACRNRDILGVWSVSQEGGEQIVQSGFAHLLCLEWWDSEERSPQIVCYRTVDETGILELGVIKGEERSAATLPASLAGVSLYFFMYLICMCFTCSFPKYSLCNIFFPGKTTKPSLGSHTQTPFYSFWI